MLVGARVYLGPVVLGRPPSGWHSSRWGRGWGPSCCGLRRWLQAEEAGAGECSCCWWQSFALVLLPAALIDTALLSSLVVVGMVLVVALLLSMPTIRRGGTSLYCFCSFALSPALSARDMALQGANIMLNQPSTVGPPPPLPFPRRQTGVQPLRPRVGALVVSIAGIPVSHVNFSAVTSLLHELMAESSQAATAAQSRDGSRRGGGGVRKVSGGWSETTMPPPSASSGAHRAGPSRVRSAPGREDGGRRMYQRPRRQRHQLLADDYNSGSRRRRSRTGNVIRVVLREVDVHAWPPNWRHEVSRRLITHGCPRLSIEEWEFYVRHLASS